MSYVSCEQCNRKPQWVPGAGGTFVNDYITRYPHKKGGVIALPALNQFSSIVSIRPRSTAFWKMGGGARRSQRIQNKKEETKGVNTSNERCHCRKYRK
jgi:hypothetical protein